MELLQPARILHSEIPLGPYPDRVTDDLVRWAREKPDAVYLAEREAGGGWRTVTYGAMLDRVRRTAAGLLAAGAHADAPVAIVAENSIDHAVTALAAMYGGIPVSPISTGYARTTSDPARLRVLLDVLGARIAYVPDPAFSQRVALADSSLQQVHDVRSIEADPAAADRAHASVGPETTAKVLFTSGSTGTPKGVITTHRMLCANQTMVAQIWPEAVADPVLVDWAPWSHTAAGNKIFGIALRHGGTMYIDAGKPSPGPFAATLANLREIAPTFYFNVPQGWALLAEALERDEDLGTRFFSRLRVALNAAASIPEPLRRRIAQLARQYAGRDVPVVSAWGSTETAPMATAVWGTRPASHVTIGTPVPGVEIKLAPFEGRDELRVRGVTVTPGYWRNGAATALAFDDEGFYRTGDAGSLLDPNDPSRGIVFGGRISENFKLASGTWVNVGMLRLAVLEETGGAVADLVLTGADRDEIGALVFPRGDPADPAVRETVRLHLRAYNAANMSASTRIARAFLLSSPPDAANGEITDKGSVNQRRVLVNRAAAIEHLYAEIPSVEVFIL